MKEQPRLGLSEHLKCIQEIHAHVHACIWDLNAIRTLRVGTLMGDDFVSMRLGVGDE